MIHGMDGFHCSCMNDAVQGGSELIIHENGVVIMWQTHLWPWRMATHGAVWYLGNHRWLLLGRNYDATWWFIAWGVACPVHRCDFLVTWYCRIHVTSIMVSNSCYINLYIIKYNVMYICGLTHHTLTWLNLVNLMPKM